MHLQSSKAKIGQEMSEIEYILLFVALLLRFVLYNVTVFGIENLNFEGRKVSR